MGGRHPAQPVPRLDYVRQQWRPRRRRRLRCRHRPGLTIPARPAVVDRRRCPPRGGRPQPMNRQGGGGQAPRVPPRPPPWPGRPTTPAAARGARVGAGVPPSDRSGRPDRVANSSGSWCFFWREGRPPTSLSPRPEGVGGAPAARLRVRRCGTGGRSRFRGHCLAPAGAGLGSPHGRTRSSPVAACSHLCDARRAARRAPCAFLSHLRRLRHPATATLSERGRPGYTGTLVGLGDPRPSGLFFGGRAAAITPPRTCAHLLSRHKGPPYSRPAISIDKRW